MKKNGIFGKSQDLRVPLNQVHIVLSASGHWVDGTRHRIDTGRIFYESGNPDIEQKTDTNGDADTGQSNRDKIRTWTKHGQNKTQILT